MGRIIRPAIDSTLLQTCKEFRENGRRILYGENPFTFCTENTSVLKRSVGTSDTCSSTTQLDIGRPNTIYCQHNILPKGGRSWEMQVAEGIQQVIMHRPIRMLCGWIYFDPFLRFIHSIGVNAAMLKELTFHGMISTHLCELTDCSARHQYHGNLLERLKLTIYAQDNIVQEEKPRHVDDTRTRKTEEALIPVLERYFRQIPSLKHLEIFEVQTVANRVYRHSNMIRTIRELPEYKIFSIEWLSQRGDIEGSNDLVMEALENQTSHTICEFCGENHIWPECCNLCKFCGAYGHFKDLPFISGTLGSRRACRVGFGIALVSKIRNDN